MPEMSKEAFAAWAESVGVNGDAEHIERLRGEVEGMMGRLAHLDDIDVSDVTPEDAGLGHNGSAS
jgi:hypothetical protein